MRSPCIARHPMHSGVAAAGRFIPFTTRCRQPIRFAPAVLASAVERGIGGVVALSGRYAAGAFL